MAEIGSIGAIQASLQAQAAMPAARRLSSVSGDEKAAAGSFATELNSAIRRVDRTMAESNGLSERLLRGENVELHTVALRAQEASLQFDLLLQVRNRLIQGYQEIMRLQV
ncbi:MAG: flagellar hook-basal body complex protein FliE [Bryobacterales bacterium]|nr:flagellar hook-basal body complex protein FliE [Bryobacterales bacterium]